MEKFRTEDILADLHQVEQQRALGRSKPAMVQQVALLKGYQQQRFANTYADLLANRRYAKATHFFLQELYGPGDFSERDSQFARVVPALTKLFPAEVVATVAKLARLHAISETLDMKMAGLLIGQGRISPVAYIGAWQTCGEAMQRQAQIDLTIEIGAALDHLTQKPLLRQALWMMRVPASAAGLSEMQVFLEKGFDNFKAMKGSEQFLLTIRLREEALMKALFAADADAKSQTFTPPTGPLGQLP